MSKVTVQISSATPRSDAYSAQQVLLNNCCWRVDLRLDFPRVGLSENCPVSFCSAIFVTSKQLITGTVLVCSLLCIAVIFIFKYRSIIQNIKNCTSVQFERFFSEIAITCHNVHLNSEFSTRECMFSCLQIYNLSQKHPLLIF